MSDSAVHNFAREVLEMIWDGRIDGFDIQACAEKHGIIRRTQFDPARHGENDVGAEPGDEWFEFTEALSDQHAAVNPGPAS